MSRHGVYDLKYGFLPDEDCPEKPQKKETNADKIRSMMDEELAEMLHNAGGNWYSSEYWLDWLKQECE